MSMGPTHNMTPEEKAVRARAGITPEEYRIIDDYEKNVKGMPATDIEIRTLRALIRARHNESGKIEIPLEYASNGKKLERILNKKRPTKRKSAAKLKVKR